MLERAIQAHRAGRLDRAIDGYRRVLRHDGQDFDVLRLLGAALVAAGRSELALPILERALSVRSDLAEVWALRGDALAQKDRHEAAAESYERALSLRPDDVPVLNRCSIQFDALGRSDDSRRCLERAVALAPADPVTRYNLGIHELTCGRLEAGWEGFEWRDGLPPRNRARPRAYGPAWDGAQPIRGRRLLLTAEQGLGDTIQFCRFAPVLAAQGAQVLLGVPPALHGLMKSLRGVAELITEGDPVPPHDLQCPLLSLPQRCRTTLATIPAQVPYLAAEPAQLRAWRELLGPAGRPRIGLAASGNEQHANDRRRSIGLHRLAPLQALGFELHWLQPDLRASDRRAFVALGVRDHRDRLRDFGATAALASCMDAVVSVDTSIAHLAGALDLPLFLLLPHLGDWRWMTTRQDSPWYPGACLLRQARPGDWDGAIAQLCERLRRLAASPVAEAGPSPG